MVLDCCGEKALDIEQVGGTEHDVTTPAARHRLDEEEPITMSDPELILAAGMTGDSHLILVREVVDQVVPVFRPGGKVWAQRDTPGSILHRHTLPRPVRPPV